MVFRFRAEGTEAALGPEAAEGSDFSFERHYKQKNDLKMSLSVCRSRFKLFKNDSLSGKGIRRYCLPMMIRR